MFETNFSGSYKIYGDTKKLEGTIPQCSSVATGLSEDSMH